MIIGLLLFFVISLNSLAQVMLKKAAIADSGYGLERLINPWFMTAIAMLGISFILWYKVIKLKPLSFLHPFLALCFLTVPILCMIFFGEELTIKYYLGIVMIMCGVSITSRSVRSQYVA